jgi:hypothetical protein
MCNEIKSLDYVIVRNGCTFSFPQPAQGDEDEVFNLEDAPKHIRFVFQGRALYEFVKAGVELLHQMADEAEQEEATAVPPHQQSTRKQP